MKSCNSIVWLLAGLTALSLLVGCAPQTQEQETESELRTETDPAPETETESTPIETEAEPDDGKPKKYFTMSFDDGCRQDAKTMEIMRQYGLDCATFFLNTGLYTDNDPDHFSLDEVRTGIYDGFEVGCHSLTHGILTDIQNDLDAIKREMGEDAANVASATGIEPTGMAWPYGLYNEKIARRIMANTTVRYARVVVGTGDFSLPGGFMQWQPSCGISDENMLELAEQFCAAECTEDMVFYVWGHGYELDQFDLYDELETLVKMMAEADDVVPVTNGEFYQIFKDDIPGWKR